MHHKKTTKKPLIMVCLLVIVLALGGGGFLFYQNYTQKQLTKQNEQIIKTLVANLNKADYAAVAASFSEGSLKADEMTTTTVAEKYQNIYGGIGVSEIKLKNMQVNDQTVNYTLSMHTDLGILDDQNYTAKIDKESQKITWQMALIFPGMTSGDKVSYDFNQAVRGEIKDRNNNGLATNGTVYNYGVVPKEMTDETIKEIAAAIDVDEDTIKEALKQTWVTDDTFVPLKTVVQVPDDLPTITGFEAREATGRTYPLGEAAAHLIGYVGKVTAEDIEKNADLAAVSMIGRAGLERAYDKELRGQDGGTIKITDSEGQEKATLQEVTVKNGEDIKLTLDSQAQYLAYQSLAGEPGASVAENPQTGELLALASSPSFDPNKMTYGISQEEYDAYDKDEDLPFMSRFANGYAPGSTFKAITAAIGLDNGTLDPDEEIAIDGLKWQKDSSWGGYEVTRVSDVTPVNLRTALVYSDNIYMAQATLKMGEDKFRAGLNELIFGEDLDLPIDMDPAQISTEDRFSSEILLADTGYGQGELLLNPIQQLTTYSVFPNGGTLVYPKLLASKETKSKADVFSKATIQAIDSDLQAVVTDANGTAHSLASLGMMLAAKTGTAEIKENQDEQGQENSFLYAYDAENKKFALLQLLENKADGQAAVDQVSDLIDYLATLKN